jgi:hypothetical protein
VITITPEILGPGIEEEYADALARIDFALAALAPAAPSNDTFTGQAVFQLLWLKQKIEARELPIPIEPSYIASLLHMLTDGFFSDRKEVEAALVELSYVLLGPGLVRPRHWPVIVSHIEDFLAKVESSADAAQLLPEERQMLAELRAIAEKLRQKAIPLPLAKEDYPAFAHCFTLPHFQKHEQTERLRDLIQLKSTLFEGRRPAAAQKPPLAAPVLGLEPHPKDIADVRRAAGTERGP